jgi:hypothetical protein
MSDHYAKEADRLLSDEVLTKAFVAVKQDALEALATVPADDITAVLRLQAHVAAIEEVRSSLKAAILRQGQPDEKASPFA